MPFPVLSHDQLLTHDQLLQCFRTSLLCGRERGDGCSLVNEHCTGRRWGMRSLTRVPGVLSISPSES
jgi:hypothetical protein